MKQFKIITLAVFGVLLLTSCEGRSQAKKETTIKKETSATSNALVQKQYKLSGFKQSCCTGIVEYSLKETKGYVKSKADVSKQLLTVWYDKNKCNESAIKKAINKTPYKIIE
ncbi:hypothetical protein [Tenacibaculum amylolyticum]|uniref:hypothetical protein n=1 Tax=Tenacibaculum amylolyticum TaxID=104269 RepID=UPI0038949C6D